MYEDGSWSVAIATGTIASAEKMLIDEKEMKEKDENNSACNCRLQGNF
jgi:hypothetical protein